MQQSNPIILSCKLYGIYNSMLSDFNSNFIEVGHTKTATTVNASENQTITITFKESTDDEIIYDEYKIIINGDTKYSGTTNTYTFETIDFDSGLYTVNACAKEADSNNWYCYTFGIKIAR